MYLVTFLWLTDKSSISNLFPAGTTASRFDTLPIYNHLRLQQLCKTDMWPSFRAVKLVEGRMQGQNHVTQTAA